MNNLVFARINALIEALGRILVRLSECAVIVFAVLSYPFAAQAEQLVFVDESTSYCPFSRCDNDKDGFIVDIVNAIYQSEGNTVTIKYVPWNRALAMVKNGNANGILGIVRKSSPELLFPKTEIAQYYTALFTLNTNPWHYEGVESLRAIRLGLIQNYGYSEGNPALDSYLSSKPPNVNWIATGDPLLHIFMMIEAGHLDATIEDISVGNYVLKKSGKSANFKVAGYLEQGFIPVYVAFTPKDPKSQQLADLFDKGMIRLRKSGKLKEILAVYGLTDWKK